MDENVIWGLLIAGYVVPFWLWQYSEHETIELRKKLYPGRAKETAQDRWFTRFSITWAVGLAGALLAWRYGWDPVLTGITLAAALLAAPACRWLLTRYKPSRRTRD